MSELSPEVVARIHVLNGEFHALRVTATRMASGATVHRLNTCLQVASVALRLVEKSGATSETERLLGIAAEHLREGRVLMAQH